MSMNQPEFDHRDEQGQRRGNQRNELGHPDEVLGEPNEPGPDAPDETMPADIDDDDDERETSGNVPVANIE